MTARGVTPRGVANAGSCGERAVHAEFSSPNRCRKTPLFGPLPLRRRKHGSVAHIRAEDDTFHRAWNCRWARASNRVLRLTRRSGTRRPAWISALVGVSPPDRDELGMRENINFASFACA